MKKQLDDSANFSCTVEVREVNQIGKHAANKTKKSMQHLTSLDVISCNNMLDMSGTQNLPTSDSLTLSALHYESYLCLHKFLN